VKAHRFGHTAYVVATVLAVFMAGLAVERLIWVGGANATGDRSHSMPELSNLAPTNPITNCNFAETLQIAMVVCDFEEEIAR